VAPAEQPAEAAAIATRAASQRFTPLRRRRRQDSCVLCSAAPAGRCPRAPGPHRGRTLVSDD
jgi:hypothetical protein